MYAPDSLGHFSHLNLPCIHVILLRCVPMLRMLC
nr:MAG TPA: hypothetical protein [Caudoviricetes sp.]